MSICEDVADNVTDARRIDRLRVVAVVLPLVTLLAFMRLNNGTLGLVLASAVIMGWSQLVGL